jgi:beta-galactosidase
VLPEIAKEHPVHLNFNLLRSQLWADRGLRVWPARSGASRRLYLELLEDRCLLDSRVVVSLDASWKFYRADVPGAQAVSFDDSAWANVDVPHTWNNIDGENGGPYYRGIGWYRQHDVIPGDWAGKEIFLRFDGASLVTDLYVNGTFVGEHQGGFAAFDWDITPYLSAGNDNVLAVKVNNAPNPNIAPLSGDFTVFGGIYRHVNLIATDPLHVSLTDYASPGVYLRQTNVSADSADLQITTKLQNDDTGSRDALILSQVLDADGNVVATLTWTQTLDPGQGADVVQATTIVSPHLWNGRADPYMYEVCVQVIDADSGVVVDQMEQPLGFRYYWVDPNNGFFLNGQPYDLHGVDFHQDRLDEGWAISDADQMQDVGLIDDIGATFVRLSHYQHPPLTYDLLDQYGIVAWSEVPFINSATSSQAFFNNVEQQLVEMIRQNYNHPSVLFWGMYNEIGDTPVTRTLVAQMVQLAHDEDPDRLTTAATDQADNAVINYLPDITAFNRYFGWYYGQTSDFGPWADNIHSVYPDRAFGISEYGAGASIYQHQDDPPPPLAGGPWHPEEYQDLFHESLWQQISARPFLWAKAVWNMFDFASASRNEGDTPGRNDKGLVTYDRQTLKDSFYWYKANWSSDPVLYITSRRYVDRPTNIVDVKVYSNLDQVELLVNGVSLGTMSSSNHIFLWTNVTLGPGPNDVAVQATQDGTTYTDDVTWYAPRAIIAPLSAPLIFQATGLMPGSTDRSDNRLMGLELSESANSSGQHRNTDLSSDGSPGHARKPATRSRNFTEASVFSSLKPQDDLFSLGDFA